MIYTVKYSEWEYARKYEIQTFANRDYVIISSSDDVGAVHATATNATAQVLYAANQHNTLAAGHAGMAGFQMNVKEYAEAVLADSGTTDRFIKTVSFSKIGVATYGLTGENLQLKIFKGTTQPVAESAMLANTDVGSTNFSIRLAFEFSNPVEIEADAVYYFYIYNNGERIGGGGEVAHRFGWPILPNCKFHLFMFAPMQMGQEIN